MLIKYYVLHICLEGVSVFASTITAVAKLDGKFIASNFEGSSPEACTDIGFGPCPWLANGKKSTFL